MGGKEVRSTMRFTIVVLLTTTLLLLSMLGIFHPGVVGTARALQAEDQVEEVVYLNPPPPPGALGSPVPKAVAAIPRLQRMYTLNTNYTLTSLDERTDAIVASAVTGPNPEGLAADEARGLLYILAQDSTARALTLEVYDATSLNRVAGVALGNWNAANLIFDVQQNVIYAAGTFTAQGVGRTRVWAIDAANRSLLGSVTYEGHYRAMARDAATGTLLLLLSHGSGSPSLVWLGTPSLAEQRRIFLPIPSGGVIGGLAIDPSRQLAYFVVGPPGGAGAGLNVLDLVGGTITGVTALGIYEAELVFDAGSKRVYVVGRQPQGGYNLVVFDTEKGQVLRSVPLRHDVYGGSGGSVTLDATRRRLYVANADSTVTVIGTASFDVRSILLSHRLGGLVFDEQLNRLFVASTNGDAVLVVDPAGRQVIDEGRGIGADPDEVLVDSSIGRLYVLSEKGRHLTAANTRSLAVETTREFPDRVYSIALNPATHRIYALMVGQPSGTTHLLALDGRTLEELGRLTLNVSQGPPLFAAALGVDAANNRVYVPRYPDWLAIDGASLTVVGEFQSSGRSIFVDSRDGRAYQFHWCDAKSCGTRTFVMDLRSGKPLAQLEDVGPVVALNSRLGHAYTTGPVGVLDVNTFDWVQIGPRADRLVADESTGFLYALAQFEGVIRIYRDRLRPSDPSTANLPVAKVEIVWPHDQSGQQRDVTETPLANVGAALFQPRSFVPLDCALGSRVTLWVAQNGEPGRPVASGSPRYATPMTSYFAPIGQLATPVWDFNDVDVRASQNPENKMYFWLSVEGRDVVTNLWSHAADARTYLPAQVVPSNVVATVGGQVDARIQILWPHDEGGNERPVSEAGLANVGVDLFEHGTTFSVPPDYGRPVRLYRSLNNGPQQLIATGRKELITRGGINYPRWFFDDVDVSVARNPNYRYFFRVAVDGATTYSSVWAHGVDARTIFPKQDVSVAGCSR